MKDLSCAAARRRLQSYHDEELTVGEQIAMDAHLERCTECREALLDLEALRAVLRAGAPGRVALASLTSEDAVGFHASVVSRIGAENRLAFSARVREMFDDMHFVYAGMGAAASTVACVMIMLSMMRFAALTSPGYNQNPVAVDLRMLMPRLDQHSYTAGATESKSDEDEGAFTVSGVITREGRVVNLELHDDRGKGAPAGSSEARAMQDMLGAMAQARFEPARVAGLPIAVNMVWLVAHTTVRAAKLPIERPAAPITKKRPVVERHLPPLTPKAFRA
jgi:hypothetical protein